ncbi:uncharacterized protein LOC135218878 isoform X2 [Macrobrachium nipponense]|uniref:uncharacterized protein LOC135218878 isoform X2 n=1 Tax=Macrobrachium nipponense TaxID=159736 RepID=UPI0030C81EBD
MAPSFLRLFNFSSKDESGDFVKTSEFLPKGTVIYKDFLPSVDPDHTTCCSKSYVSFSEIVQEANEWLGKQENYEVVNCESIILPQSSEGDPVVPDSWPISRHLRGLRVWIKANMGDETQNELQQKLKFRYLISYRDFSPIFDRKSMFNSKYEDASVLLERINNYLADRSTAARVISLQTLDTPMVGLLDLDVDTEKSRISFSQHGFTRFCRSLRLFSVTKYKRGTLATIIRQPKVAFRDFAPSHSSGGHELLTDVVKRALQWTAENDVSILNVQVLPLRAGESSTASSTWLLESPGHIPNKFTSFVRVVYVTSPDVNDPLLESTTVEVVHQDDNENENTAGDEENNDPTETTEVNGDTEKSEPTATNETEGSDVASVPGMVTPRESSLDLDSSSPLHGKVFTPRVTEPGGFCKKAEWETLNMTVDRINSWTAASQGNILTIHTQYVYCKDDDVDPQDTRWAKHMTGGRQVGVFWIVVVDGRPPTALPPNSSSRKSKCAIM